MSFTRMDRMVLESYKTLCEGLANYLGDGYEIVLHSLENYDNSVIKIINGYYTGRDHRSCAAYAGGYPPQQRQGLYRLLFKKQKGRAHAFHDDRHPQREREDRRAAVH